MGRDLPIVLGCLRYILEKALKDDLEEFVGTVAMYSQELDDQQTPYFVLDPIAMLANSSSKTGVFQKEDRGIEGAIEGDEDDRWLYI
jgi:hypothetical protein